MGKIINIKNDYCFNTENIKHRDINNQLVNLKEFLNIENFTNKVNFSETNHGNVMFFKSGNLIFINYQGESKTHKYDDIIFTLPERYRPNYQIHLNFNGFKNLIGQAVIYPNGECKITSISDESEKARIAINVFYSL